MSNDIDTAAETEVTPVTFHSEASNYRVVMVPQRRRQIGESNESEIVGGRDIQFYDGVYVARTQEEIDWLRDYKSNGEYYWEVGSAEDRPGNSADLQAEIMRRALDGDFGFIADVLVAERAAQSRPEVLSACTAALSAAGEQAPPPPATPLHEQQRVRVGPTAGITPGVSPDPVPGSPQVDPSTLTAPPGQPASPEGVAAVPVGQVPAAGETPDGVSDTMPNATGPLAAGQPEIVGDATVISDVPPVAPEASTEPTESTPPSTGAGAAGAPAPGTE